MPAGAEFDLAPVTDDAAAQRSGTFPPGAPPLREAVLAGRFFGPAQRDAGTRLADLIAGPAGEAGMAWFGAAAFARLARDPDRLRAAIDRDIAAIDRLLSAQTDAILHAPRMRLLEGRWRSLHWLVDGIDPAPRLKVKLLNLPWPELCRDLERAPEFDQSNLFRHVYENEFGMPGGEPIGLLVVD